MFEATAKPPTARIRALATKTASSGRDILEVIMSFASLKLGLNPHVFHCSRRQKDSVHRYLRSNVALSTTNLANFSLDSVENDRGRLRIGVDPDMPLDHVRLAPSCDSRI